MNVIPTKIRFAEGFREDVIVFARALHADTVATNLPVDKVPAELSALSSGIAEKALLAYVIANGGSVQYAARNECIEEMHNLARAFSDEFLQPLRDDGVTQVIPLADVAVWYRQHALYKWGRLISSAPGEEFG